MRALFSLVLLVACSGSKDDEPTDDATVDTDTDTPTTDTDTTAEPSPWQVLANEIPGGAMLSAYSESDEVLIVGGELSGTEGTLWRYTTDRLCYESIADQPIWWIHGAGDGTWTAVGAKGAIVQFDGTTMTRHDVPTEATLFGVYVDGEEAWAVGGDVFGSQLGEIWHRDATGVWSNFRNDLPGLIFKTWKGWFVGPGQAYYYDGTELLDRTPPGDPYLLTVRGSSVDDIWVVGGLSGAEVHHYSNGTWESPELDPQCVGRPLKGVFTGPGEDVWIAGEFGTATSFADGAWNCAEFPITDQHFHAAWRDGEQTLFVGGNLNASSSNYGTLASYGGDGTVPVVEPCD